MEPKRAGRRPASPGPKGGRDGHSDTRRGASGPRSSSSPLRRAGSGARQPAVLAGDRLDRLGVLLASLTGFAQPLDTALSAHFKANRLLNSRERAFQAEAVYAAVRRWTAFHAVLSELGYPQGVPNYARRLAMMAAGHSIGLARFVTEITPGERAWLENALAQVEALEPAARYSIPDWMLADVVAQLPEGFEQLDLMKALDEQATLDLRVNLLRGTPSEALRMLADDGIRARQHSSLPECIRIEGRPALQRSDAFTSGLVEVQDLGSQLLARLAAPRRGAFVVDYCAGAGGKTLALGAMMRNTGRLYALDNSATRLARLKPRLARSGLSNVWPIAITGQGDERLRRLRGKADVVLVDAPCTGLGTLRRNPDLKWRQSPTTLSNLLGIQANILTSAAQLLKPGGRLVYATCSLRRDENEGQVEAFLQAHPDFQIRPVDAELVRQDVQLPERWRAFTPEGALRLWTHRTDTDCFYGVILERAKPADTGMLTDESAELADDLDDLSEIVEDNGFAVDDEPPAVTAD